MNAGRLIRSRSTWLLLVGLVPVIAAGTLAHINDFDGLYGQDAFAYYRYAVDDLRAQLYPPPPFFWPPGYPLLTLLMTLFVGITPLAGQWVSLMCGGLTVAFTGLLTREVWHSNDNSAHIAALVAGLTMAFTGQLWQSSAVIMADTLSLAAATLGMWALVRCRRLVTERTGYTRAAHWLALAFGALAYAMITRWIYGAVALIAAPLALAIVYRVWQTSPRRGLVCCLLAAIPALVILGPVLLPALMTSPSTDTTFGGNFQNQLTRWDIQHALQRDFINPDGYLSYRLPNAVYYSIMPARPFYFGPVLAVFALVGLLTILRRRAVGKFAPLLAWWIVVYLLLVGGPQQNVRFGLSYMPPLAALAGIGAAALWSWSEQYNGGKRAGKVTAGLAAVIGAGLLWAGIGAVQWTQDFIDHQKNSLQTVRWAEAHIPPDGQVIALGLTLTMQHYTPLETYEIYSLTVAEVAAIIEHDRPTYLLLDVANVETQWRDQTPALHYGWLRDVPGLTRVDQRGSFTLFRVNNT